MCGFGCPQIADTAKQMTLLQKLEQLDTPDPAAQKHHNSGGHQDVDSADELMYLI